MGGPHRGDAGVFIARNSQSRTRAENLWMRQPVLSIADQVVSAESDAAAIKHSVVRIEKTRGVVKAYIQVSAVIATKQMASAHAMLRTRAKVSGGSAASNHASTAANKRNTVKKSPKALKKSQYVRVNPCASKWTERIRPRTASAAILEYSGESRTCARPQIALEERKRFGKEFPVSRAASCGFVGAL